jgi:hypothetical protein
LLVAHGTRRNIQTYIDRLITQAKQDQAAIGVRFNALILEVVADIQHHIPAAQLNHTTTYIEDDVAQEGDASHACMPEGAQPKQMWLVDKRTDVEGELIKFLQVPWPHRYHQMINRSAVHLMEDDLGSSPLVAIEYGGREFYIWPALVEDAYEGCPTAGLLDIGTGIQDNYDPTTQTRRSEEVKQPSRRAARGSGPVKRSVPAVGGRATVTTVSQAEEGGPEASAQDLENLGF